MMKNFLILTAVLELIGASQWRPLLVLAKPIKLPKVNKTWLVTDVAGIQSTTSFSALEKFRDQIQDHTSTSKLTVSVKRSKRTTSAVEDISITQQVPQIREHAASVPKRLVDIRRRPVGVTSSTNYIRFRINLDRRPRAVTRVFTKRGLSTTNRPKSSKVEVSKNAVTGIDPYTKPGINTGRKSSRLHKILTEEELRETKTTMASYKRKLPKMVPSKTNSSSSNETATGNIRRKMKVRRNRTKAKSTTLKKRLQAKPKTRKVKTSKDLSRKGPKGLKTNTAPSRKSIPKQKSLKAKKRLPIGSTTHKIKTGKGPVGASAKTNSSRVIYTKGRSLKVVKELSTRNKTRNSKTNRKFLKKSNRKSAAKIAERSRGKLAVRRKISKNKTNKMASETTTKIPITLRSNVPRRTPPKLDGRLPILNAVNMIKPTKRFSKQLTQVSTTMIVPTSPLDVKKSNGTHITSNAPVLTKLTTETVKDSLWRTMSTGLTTKTTESIPNITVICIPYIIKKGSVPPGFRIAVNVIPYTISINKATSLRIATMPTTKSIPYTATIGKKSLLGMSTDLTTRHASYANETSPLSTILYKVSATNTTFPDITKLAETALPKVNNLGERILPITQITATTKTSSSRTPIKLSYRLLPEATTKLTINNIPRSITVDNALSARVSTTELLPFTWFVPNRREFPESVRKPDARVVDQEISPNTKSSRKPKVVTQTNMLNERLPYRWRFSELMRKVALSGALQKISTNDKLAKRAEIMKLIDAERRLQEMAPRRANTEIVPYRKSFDDRESSTPFNVTSSTTSDTERTPKLITGVIYKNNSNRYSTDASTRLTTTIDKSSTISTNKKAVATKSLPHKVANNRGLSKKTIKESADKGVRRGRKNVKGVSQRGRKKLTMHKTNLRKQTLKRAMDGSGTESGMTTQTASPRQIKKLTIKPIPHKGVIKKGSLKRQSKRSVAKWIYPGRKPSEVLPWKAKGKGSSRHIAHKLTFSKDSAKTSIKDPFTSISYRKSFFGAALPVIGKKLVDRHMATTVTISTRSPSRESTVSTSEVTPHRAAVSSTDITRLANRSISGTIEKISSVISNLTTIEEI